MDFSANVIFHIAHSLVLPGHSPRAYCTGKGMDIVRYRHDEGSRSLSTPLKIYSCKVALDLALIVRTRPSSCSQSLDSELNKDMHGHVAFSRHK